MNNHKNFVQTYIAEGEDPRKSRAWTHRCSRDVQDEAWEPKENAER